MTADEELLCRSWNRDLYNALRQGEITSEEATFLARRVEFNVAIEFLPALAVEAAIALYDFFLEP